MPYCRNCGAQIPEGSAYCQNCGTRVTESLQRETTEPSLRLAGWGDRFLAWLIDVILIGIAVGVVKGLFFIISWPAFSLVPGPLRSIPFADFGLDNMLYLLYWTFFEGTTGQSIGKRVMRIRTTRLNGEPLDLMGSALQSVGKAFLLPIDCIIGWIVYPRHRQRLFSYLSGSVVSRV